MSAPDTNIKTQERRHSAPLTGIKVAVGLAAVLFVVWLGWLMVAADSPVETAPASTVDIPAAETTGTAAGD